MLKDKRILLVDDEPDILETLVDLLQDCQVVTASSYEEAQKYLTKESFDLAVLDIMGVDGYQLLETAVSRDITAVMLTARAITPEDTVKSFKEGAAYFVPKDEMHNLQTFLTDVLEAKAKKENPWLIWLKRFTPFYNQKFDTDWQDRDREFWDKYIQKYRNW